MEERLKRDVQNSRCLRIVPTRSIRRKNCFARISLWSLRHNRSLHDTETWQTSSREMLHVLFNVLPSIKSRFRYSIPRNTPLPDPSFSAFFYEGYRFLINTISQASFRSLDTSFPHMEDQLLSVTRFFKNEI